MAAFLIVEINGVRDEAAYALYREEVPANLAAAGGQYLVRGGEVDPQMYLDSPVTGDHKLFL